MIKSRFNSKNLSGWIERSQKHEINRNGQQAHRPKANILDNPLNKDTR
ncbi:hypothetical protein H6F72_27015 [Trichocoleus sp. FACHB-46]|nr:hypothetical protein [Trichocoleus sp. FACHB-46]